MEAQRSSRLKRFLYWATTLVVALVPGLFLPALAIWLHLGGEPFFWNPYGEKWSFPYLVDLWGLALVWCGPGAFLFSVIVYDQARVKALSCPERSRVFWCGTFWGAFLAFFNLPAYWVLVLFSDEWLAWARFFALLAISGASGGLWIGWRIYRRDHPDETWRRFSLRTLICLVMGWGVLLALFMPS